MFMEQEMSLDDFSTESVELSDLTAEESGPKPSLAKNSNMNRTAMSVAISGEPDTAEANGKAGLTELSQTGESTTLKGLVAGAGESVVKQTGESLVEGLLSPELDDGAKSGMLEQYQSLNSQPPTTQELYVGKLLVEDGGERTEKDYEVRAMQTDMISDYWKSQAEMQAMINSTAANMSLDTKTNMLDMIELYLIPTAYGVGAKNFLGAVQAEIRGEDTTGLSDYIFAGNAYKHMHNMIKEIPASKKPEFMRAMMGIIDSESGIYLRDDNDFAKYNMLRQMEGGEYTTADQMVDNIVGVLDLIPVFGKLALGAKTLAKGSDVVRQAVVGTSLPVSSGRVALETNPIAGFKVVEEALKHEEISQALFGVKPIDLAVETMGPKPIMLSGTVAPLPNSKAIHGLSVDGPAMRSADEDVLASNKSDGQIHYTFAEKESAIKNIETGFQEASGLTHRPELSSVGHNNGIQINSVYTAGDTGFLSAKDAREKVKFALKEYGINDADITILQRTPEGYSPLGVKTSTDEMGDFVAQVNYNSKISPNDIKQWTDLNVKRNIFDRVSSLVGTGVAGSMQRHLLDAHSMLNKTLTLGANVAVDKGARMTREITDLGKVFTENFKKMDLAQQTAVGDYIKEANLKGIEHTPAQLHSLGFTPEGVAALTSWRKTWDTVYWLENADLVRTLKASGYQSLKNGTDDLLVRKEALNLSNNRAYNPATGKVEPLTPDELRKLYDEGGYIGSSRTPLPIGDEAISSVIVKNDASSYATALREDVPLVPYTKGYYTVNYEAPVFIDRIVKDKNGKELYTQAVGMARDIPEAKMLRKDISDAGGELEESFVIRENKNNIRMSVDDKYDMQQAMGRTSQRVRGKRLQEPTQRTTGGPDGTLLEDPIKALETSARSIGNRVAMRDWLEASKTRFVEQFGKYIPTVNGRKAFPRDIAKLGLSGETTSKGIADARTTWEYINYMENGYINSLDDTLKGTFRAIGNILGNAGYGRGQRAMEWMVSHGGITGASKGAAFQLYIAMNPARQVLVQSHQMIRLSAINPKYALGKMMPDLVEFYKGAKGEGSIHKFVMDSGQVDAISRSNLMRDSMLEISHQHTKAGKAKSKVVNTLKIPEKGFTFGETNNVVTSILSFRNQAIKNGEDITNTAVRDKIYAEARNFTYNMTKAGDMPYNQNALGIIMQFLQVPHKAMTQTLFNRVLTSKQKASALMFDTVMFGIPAYWAADKWFPDALPKDPMVRESIETGMEGLMFNQMLNLITEEHSEIDLTSLAPTSGQGFADLFTRSMEEGLFGLVSKSPSGQLLFGSNPRISNFMKDLAVFTGADAGHDEMTTAKLLKSGASLFSGMSNAFKAQYALEYGKVINSRGMVIDENTTTVEGLFMIMGLPPKDVHEYYKTNQKLYTKSQEFRDDIDEWYKETKRQLVLAGGDVDAETLALDTMSMGWKVWGAHEVEARKYLTAKIKRDMKVGDDYLVNLMLKRTGMITNESQWRMLVQDAPISEEKKKMLIEQGESIYKMKEDD